MPPIYLPCLVLLGICSENKPERTKITGNAKTKNGKRGRLADTDVRWDTISGSVDDRTEEEMRPPDEPLLRELDTTEFLDGSGDGSEEGGKYVRAKRQPKSR